MDFSYITNLRCNWSQVSWSWPANCSVQSLFRSCDNWEVAHNGVADGCACAQIELIKTG